MNGSTSGIEQVLGILGISIAAVGFISFAIWLLTIIARWRVFQKTGEPGWKSIIPIYSGYTLFKVTWKSSMFWIMFLLGIVGAYMINSSGGSIDAGTAGTGAVYYIGCILYLAMFVIYVMQNFKTSKAFGHGVVFGLGLIFFNFIFLMVLGFGSSKYIGPQK